MQGIRRMNAQIATDARVVATTLQTVGRKGYDGFVLAVVQPVPRVGPEVGARAKPPCPGRLFCRPDRLGGGHPRGQTGS